MNYRNTFYCAQAAFVLGLAINANGQESVGDPITPAPASVRTLEEVVVTARRREESLQTVPISMTVYSQAQLDDRNISSASDLALYTPSLFADTRFGDNNSSFAIRGFTQELRTTPSVAVYFADVASPRAPGPITSGDGAGPGAFFDLQNVQVLKGPQGTLFGRNTTGGAILLVPKKPTDEFGGYLEGSAGDYAMQRLQGVVNVPISDNVRARLGIDTQERDGYIDNTSGIGPDNFNNLDYLSARASLVIDITPDLENYTILTYSESETNGPMQQVLACNSNPGPADFFAAIFGPMCAAQLADSSDDFYAVQNYRPDPVSKQEQYQLVNTTTWQMSDVFTVKNIFSYGHQEGKIRTALWGTNFQFAGSSLYFTGVNGDTTSSQESFVEEIQFQGLAFDSRLTWQGGLYYENSKPDEPTGSSAPSYLSCDPDTLSGNAADYLCNDVLKAAVPLLTGLAGAVGQSGEVEYTTKAIYAQGSYDLIPDVLALTAGIRYTWDETESTVENFFYRFPGSFIPGDYQEAAPLGPSFVDSVCTDPSAEQPGCRVSDSKDSDAPTWLLGLDYNVTPDMLLYGKYARGYRQGSVNTLGISFFKTYEPEKVDTYEIGSKMSFRGAVPGTFNIAAFYNDFKDQQIALGIFPLNSSPNTAIVNAGASTIWGVEIETNLQLFDGLILSAGYTYLNTEIDEINMPDIPAGLLAAPPSLTAAEGDPLSYSPENKLSLTLSYDLPVPVSVGEITAAVTYTYTDDQQGVTKTSSPYAVLPSYELINVNLNWDGIAGSNFDGSLFVTNLTNEEYHSFVLGTYNAAGFEIASLGPPRMWGARLRYNF